METNALAHDAVHVACPSRRVQSARLRYRCAGGRVWVFRRRLRAYTLRASANCAESLATPDGAAFTPTRSLPHGFTSGAARSAPVRITTPVSARPSVDERALGPGAYPDRDASDRKGAPLTANRTSGAHRPVIVREQGSGRSWRRSLARSKRLGGSLPRLAACNRGATTEGMSAPHRRDDGKSRD